MTHSRQSILAGAALTALALALAPAAMAQDPGAQPGQQPGQQPPAEQQQPMQEEAPAVEEHSFSDSELEQFAQAFIEVEEVRNEYGPRLGEAEDMEAATEIQQEANEQMTSAIEDNGLTVETYNAIAQSTQADPELREQILEKVEATR